MFPLCISCAETKNQEICKHNKDERSSIGTWKTAEKNKAVEMDYIMIKIYEVWHF